MADVNVILTEVGVNMGDHAQDVQTALEVSPETTIQDLVDTVLTNDHDYDYGNYVTIRLARPIGGESK